MVLSGKSLRGWVATQLCVFFVVWAFTPPLHAAEPIHLKLDAGSVPRRNSPVSVRLEIGNDITLDQTKVILRAGLALQLVDVADKAHHAMAAFEPVRVEGRLVAVVLHWVQPKLDTKKPVVMLLDEAPLDSGDFYPFEFKDSPAERRLTKGNMPFWTHGPLRFDPTAEVSAFTQRHVLYLKAFQEEDDSKPSPIGDLLWGWSKVEAGEVASDFWQPNADASNRHRMFLNDRQVLADTVARSVSMAHWYRSPADVVMSETRSMMAWAATSGHQIYDLQVFLASKARPVSLQGKGGLSFRPAEDGMWQLGDVLKSKRKGAWVAARFSRDAQSFWWVQMLHPGDEEHRGEVAVEAPSQSVGLHTKHRIMPKVPLVLAYRLMLLDAAKHSKLNQKALENMYQDFLNPVRVTVVKKNG